MSEDTSPASPEQADPNAGVVPAEPKRREHYNTQFLVANFEKEERRTRFILMGVAVAIMAGIGAALMLGGGGEKEKPAAMEGAAVEAAKPAAETPKAPVPGAATPLPPSAAPAAMKATPDAAKAAAAVPSTKAPAGTPVPTPDTAQKKK